MTTDSRPHSVYASHSKAIQRAAQDFGDHEGVTEGKVLRWLLNFSDADLEVGIKVLQRIRYYSISNIWAMTQELVKIVRKEFADTPWDKVFFVPMGAAYSGAMTIARVLRDTRVVQKSNIKFMADLEKMPPEKLGVLVFIDDFSGTGKTLQDWWPLAESIVLPKKVPFVLGLLVLNGKARSVVEKLVGRVYCVDELDETENVLSSVSPHFSSTEKDTLGRYCKATKASVDYVHGLGECGLLLAFKHGCPNDSLPILWHASDSWDALFRRSGY